MRPELHYAVVVGINKYPDPMFAKLRGPTNDAEMFVKWLKEDAKLPDKNIEWIQIDTDSFDSVETAVPTRALINDRLLKVMDAVGEQIKKKPLDWLDTRLYVYLSGHGIAQSARETTVLMANARRGVLGENSIPCGAYADYFQDMQFFAEVVFFADCCRTREKKAKIHGPGFDLENVNRGEVRRCVAFATGFGDLSYEPTDEEVADPDQTRGYFTTALLEALRGGIAPEEEVNTETIEKYVKARVRELTADKRVPQEPIIDAPQRIVFRLAQQPKPPVVYPIRILFPSGWAEPVVLSDGLFKPIQTHNPAGQTEWTYPLADGMYEVRPAADTTGKRFKGNGLFRVLGGASDVQL
jgi:uncharacterized caspase-like protein